VVDLVLGLIVNRVMKSRGTSADPGRQSPAPGGADVLLPAGSSSTGRPSTDAAASTARQGPPRTSGPLTELAAGSSKRRRRRRRGAQKAALSAADGPSPAARGAEWPTGLFNLSFDDDCHTGGYLALLFPSVDGQGWTTQGDSAAASKDGAPPSLVVSERSWLGGGATTTYGGDITPGGGMTPGSLGGPTTRDTRPLIADDDAAGGDAVGGRESALRIVGEVLLPFLLAGLGSVMAGLVLDLVQVGACWTKAPFIATQTRRPVGLCRCKRVQRRCLTG